MYSLSQTPALEVHTATRASRLDTYCSNGGERASPSLVRVVPVLCRVDTGVHLAVHSESGVRSVVGLRVL